MHQSIPAAQSPLPPRLLRHLPALSVPGVGHQQILRFPGTGHLPTPRPLPSFWHARGFLSEYNYSEDFTGKTSRLAHLLRTRKNCRGLLKHILDFTHAFLHCLSSPKYIAKSGAIDVNQRFYGYWVKLLSILFEEHAFIFINYSEQITLQHTINFNVSNFITILKQ